jgi:hypothetical protein
MSDVPDRVHALMTGRVNSIEKLVVIVELGKRSPRKMLLSEILRAVPFELTMSSDTIQELQHAKLVTISGESIELATDEPDLDALLRFYEEDPVGTVTALSKISITRIRGMAHAFADAFVLRKKR